MRYYILYLTVYEEKLATGKCVAEDSTHAEGGQDALEPIPTSSYDQLPRAEEKRRAVRALESYGDCGESLAVVETVRQQQGQGLEIDWIVGLDLGCADYVVDGRDWDLGFGGIK